MRNKNKSVKAIKSIDAQRAASLLRPIASFLLAGGMAEAEALSIFSAALRKSASTALRRRIDHIGQPACYADVIAEWSRDKQYLDRSGWPRALKMSGRNGFVSLVRRVDSDADARKVMAVLKRYGNVRSTTDGKFALKNSFFNTSGPTAMAYEPVAYFLSDASATLGRILKRPKHSPSPPLFWQKTENNSISEKQARKFFAFAKDRSLVFLDELDDWLEAHRTPRKVGFRPSRKIGLGIFSIYSKPER
jgi:hypothetical protein